MASGARLSYSFKQTIVGKNLLSTATILIISVVLFSVPLLAKPAKNDGGEVDTSYPVSESISKIKPLEIEDPAWLIEQRSQAAASPRRTAAGNITVTYSVTSRGAISASLAEFKLLANQTLNSPSGWSKIGLKFSEVASGGDFVLVLSSADQVPSFSPSGCSSSWSCNVGNYVIINQDRWLGASTSWNAAGGSLRDYRHMVINHETGHWLGHGHTYCSGAGNPASVMQQQSIDLGGCKFNPWPLGSELLAPRYGI